jgi:hypothetical protein
VETWFTSDSAAYDSNLPPYFVAPAASIGVLGTIYPAETFPQDDAGGSSRVVHLLHRQPGDGPALEEVTFTTGSAEDSVVGIQLAEPRALIVGYSDFPGQTIAAGFGALRRYVCAEDGD